MAHHSVPRFTHNFIIYEGDALPEEYNGRLFGIEPLQGRVVMSSVETDLSSFKTHDVGHPVTTTDPRFRPVDIKVGPEGAIYLADMYEPQISHREHFSGTIDKETGRIYRVQRKGATPQKPVDVQNATSAQLVELLANSNKTNRQTVLRRLGDRKDATLADSLKEKVAAASGQPALEYLWALYACGGLDESFAIRALGHEDEYVRGWTVRLLCDEKSVASAVAAKLAELARNEAYVSVRSQLASSARRLPAEQSLPIVVNLLAHDEDLDDVHVPLLLWWAIEAKAASNRESVVDLFKDPSLWKRPIVEKHIVNRLIRRYAQSGSRDDLATCAKIFALAPDGASSKLLMQGFEAAFKGRSLASLPTELAEALAKSGGGSLVLGVRQGKADAVNAALALVADDKADSAKRLECVQVFGEVDQPACVPVLLKALAGSSDDALRMAVLTALQRYSEPSIGTAVIDAFASASEDVKTAALTLLVSRTIWNRQLLDAIDAGRVDAKSIPLDAVRKMTVHQDEAIANLVRKHWHDIQGASTAEMQQQIARVSSLLNGETGDPYEGKTLFNKTCAKCHLLFGEGGRIGPDLTTFKRDDATQILINIVNPSAEVREGFESYLVVTNDGRTLNGFLFDQDNQIVVLRGADGQNITIERENIEEMIKQRTSLMPEGLLKDLNDQEIRNLFAYIRSSQPLNN
jgi:putative heme-binding domain-containing protein